MKQTNKGLNQHKNKIHSVKHAVNTLCIHKIRLTLQGLTTLKIGELLLAANCPNLSDLAIWRVTVSYS